MAEEQINNPLKKNSQNVIISILTSKGIKTQGYPDFYSGYPKN